MLRCLDDCLFVCLVTDLAPIWDAFWMPWFTCGVTWDSPCKLVGASGLDWVSQGAQMSRLALLCRREHRFREICWILGQKVGRPVAACGNELQPSRSPIEEDKMIRCVDLSILAPQILDSSCLGARRAGFLDFSCLATLAGWIDVLFWALLRVLGLGKG